MITRVLFLLLALPLMCPAQQVAGDSLLATERAIDRPLTLHARQLRVTGGYALSILSRRFDAHGDVFSLRDVGSSSIKHRFEIDIKYGINDFVQLTTGIAGTEQVVRGRTEYIFPQQDDPVVSHQIINKYSGLEDLFVGVDLRAPLRTRKFDMALALGAYLPISPSESKQPDHSYSLSQRDGEPMQKFTYRYFYPQGQGVPVAQIGAHIKYRMKTMAFSGRVDYRHGLDDATRVEWKHQFDASDGFEYRKTTYTHRLPDSFSYFFEAEFQPRPWLDLFINISGYTAYRGWISVDGELKVAVPYQTIAIASPGAEIIITPRLWVRERLDIAVAGKNSDAPIGFETTVMYNLFPF